LMLTAIDPPDQLAASFPALTNPMPIPGNPLEFDCQTATGKVRLRPYHRLQRDIYSTYFQHTSKT
jgi:hypothetical protein